MASLGIPNNQVVKDEPAQGSSESLQSQSADVSVLDLLNLELTFKDDDLQISLERDAIRQTLGRVTAMQRVIGADFSEQIASSPESSRVLDAQGAASARTGTIVQVPNAPTLPIPPHQA